MTGHAYLLSRTPLVCLAVLASGCSLMPQKTDSGTLSKVGLPHVSHDDHADSQGTTTIKSKLAMDLSQSLELDDIKVDVEGLKRVIATAEARARAEALRRKRLPGLRREQQEALGFGQMNFPPQGSGAIMRSAEYGVDDQWQSPFHQVADADIVVGVDECGKPIVFEPEPLPEVAPDEIPYVVNMRLNFGIDGARMERPRLHHSGRLRHGFEKLPRPCATPNGCPPPVCGPRCPGCSVCSPKHVSAAGSPRHLPPVDTYRAAASPRPTAPAVVSPAATSASMPERSVGGVAGWPSFDTEQRAPTSGTATATSSPMPIGPVWRTPF